MQLVTPPVQMQFGWLLCGCQVTNTRMLFNSPMTFLPYPPKRDSLLCVARHKAVTRTWDAPLFKALRPGLSQIVARRILKSINCSEVIIVLCSCALICLAMSHSDSSLLPKDQPPASRAADAYGRAGRSRGTRVPPGWIAVPKVHCGADGGRSVR
jgi:hypothetical protein